MGCRATTIGAIALAVCSVSGCSLVLDFSDRADAAPDFNPNCEAFEPNDEVTAPAQVAPNERHDAALCGDDRDFYQITVGEFDDLTVMADGAPGLNLKLELTQSGLTIDSSDSLGPVESISRAEATGNALPAGVYVAEIAPSSQAIGGSEGNYSLLITLTNNPPVADAGPVD